MAVNLVQTRNVESVVELGINLDINDRACLIIMSRQYLQNFYELVIFTILVVLIRAIDLCISQSQYFSYVRFYVQFRGNFWKGLEKSEKCIENMNSKQYYDALVLLKETKNEIAANKIDETTRTDENLPINRPKNKCTIYQRTLRIIH